MVHKMIPAPEISNMSNKNPWCFLDSFLKNGRNFHVEYTVPKLANCAKSVPTDTTRLTKPICSVVKIIKNKIPLFK